MFYNPHVNINANIGREKAYPATKRTYTLFILCADSPPILTPFFDLLSAAANIDVIDKMPCTICSGGEVVRASPNVVDDKLEVICRRCDVDHRLEAFRASPVMCEEQKSRKALSVVRMNDVWNICLEDSEARRISIKDQLKEAASWTAFCTCSLRARKIRFKPGAVA